MIDPFERIRQSVSHGDCTATPYTRVFTWCEPACNGQYGHPERVRGLLARALAISPISASWL